jgi:hypothetical protein
MVTEDTVPINCIPKHCVNTHLEEVGRVAAGITTLGKFICVDDELT